MCSSDLVDTIPLSKNEKLDRKSVLDALAVTVEVSVHRSDSELERRVEVIWKEVLGLSECSNQANFFSLGGDSLAAARVTRMIQSRINESFCLREFLDAPTIEAVAATIDDLVEQDDSFEEGEL